MAAIKINRAPVLTLWTVIVARRAGLSDNKALSVGRAVAGLTAQSKGRRLGLYKQSPASETERIRRLREDLDTRSLEFMHCSIPIVRQGNQIRALSKAKPIQPDSVRRYLDSRFGEHLATFEARLTALAKALPVEELLAQAMDVYTKFRPIVPAGVDGWGKKALFDTKTVAALMPPSKYTPDCER